MNPVTVDRLAEMLRAATSHLSRDCPAEVIAGARIALAEFDHERAAMLPPPENAR